MTDDELPKTLRVCILKLKRDATLGWTLSLGEVTPSCRETLKEVSEKLGPHSKRYLAKRLATTNLEAREHLKELGLYWELQPEAEMDHPPS